MKIVIAFLAIAFIVVLTESSPHHHCGDSSSEETLVEFRGSEFIKSFTIILYWKYFLRTFRDQRLEAWSICEKCRICSTKTWTSCIRAVQHWITGSYKNINLNFVDDYDDFRIKSVNKFAIQKKNSKYFFKHSNNACKNE